MQVERERIISKDMADRLFDKPEEFDPKKVPIYLAEPDVKEIHVFKATPSNLRMANLRHKHPNKTRKQLRKMR